MGKKEVDYTLNDKLFVSKSKFMKIHKQQAIIHNTHKLGSINNYMHMYIAVARVNC